MKKYRFIGDPKQYNGDDNEDYVLCYGAILKEDVIPKEWSYNVKWHVDRHPTDWEEVIDTEVEKKEILDAVTKPFNNLAMNDEEADKFIEERLEAIRKSLLVKAKEYVRNSDRMHNFNVASQKTGKTREECLAGFRLKHEVSVDDIRNDIKLGLFPKEEVVKEKFGDIINYYILEEMSILHKIKYNGQKI
jgi:hypothetical protein